MSGEGSKGSVRASSTAYCHDIVRRNDKDRYLASLFVPEDNRPHLWALYAFNHEIARVREMISQPAAGEVRLQWWLEALGSLAAGGSPDHPVLDALGEAVQASSLPIAALVRLIEARRFDLYDDPMPTLTDLEGYLGETSSVLIQLAAMTLAGAEAARATAATAGYAGVAYGLAGLLRALPSQRAHGQCFVPRDLLAAEGLLPADLLTGKPREALARVIGRIIALARERLAQARARRDAIPAAALVAFLPASLTEAYLTKLARAGSDVLDHVVEVPQWRRQIILWRMARAARF
jgi:15-cis-phytoene synthase